MRRLARLDPPGILHRMIIRGIERRRIFRDLQGVVDFVDLCPTWQEFPTLSFQRNRKMQNPAFHLNRNNVVFW